MDKSLKNGMLLIAFAMLLLTVSINIDSVINLISSFFSLLMPIIFGLIFAFILSVPMKFFENFLYLFFMVFICCTNEMIIFYIHQIIGVFQFLRNLIDMALW